MRQVPCAKDFFDGLSQEEFIRILTEAGFDAAPGTGKIHYTEEPAPVQDKFQFTIKGTISVHKYVKSIEHACSFPSAS